MNKTNLCRAISIILLVAWMITIFAFSSQNSNKSSATSSAFVENFISTIYPQFDDLSVEKQLKTTDFITVFVRKAAHFFEYFILGILSLTTIYLFKKYKLFNCCIISFMFCVIYAISDEVHQYFVPGRACRVIDVCVDSAGAISAIVLLSIIYTRSRKAGESNAKKEIN